MGGGNERSGPGPEGPATAPLAVTLIVPRASPESAGVLLGGDRLAAGLRDAGLQPRMVDAAEIERGTAAPEDGTIVHALHAVETGTAAARWAGGRPVVWTLTTTDLGPEQVEALAPAVPDVAAIVVSHAEGAAQLRALLPRTFGRVHVVPPGVAAPSPASRRPPAARRVPASGQWPVRRRNEVVFLLPSGVSADRDPDLAVAILDHVRGAGVPARLWITGPVGEGAFASHFLERVARRPFVQYLRDLPPEAMPALYPRCDIVLNTSRAEGLSDALLEAMAAGCAVLATDIPGNRAAIRNAVDGILAPAREMPGAALGLAQAPHQRRRLAASARRGVLQRFDPRSEVRAHLALYRLALDGPAGASGFPPTAPFLQRPDAGIGPSARR